MPKEKPILFSGPMVRAILSGQKTVTRRPVKGMALQWLQDGFELGFVADPDNALCPYGKPGDRLWVRETWYCDHFDVQKGPYKKPEDLDLVEARENGTMVYAADGLAPYEVEQPIWKPSIHMPRWASRILLEITAVRVERLQDITEQQAEAEGVERPENITNVDVWDGAERELFNAMNQPRARFVRLWGDINGPDSWNANPWVWVVEFKRVTA